MSLAPYFDLIYSHLPGGSFFSFLYSLPDSQQIQAGLFQVPGFTTVFSALSNLGAFG